MATRFPRWVQTIAGLAVVACAIYGRVLLAPWLGQRLELITLWMVLVPLAWLLRPIPFWISALAGLVAATLIFLEPGREQYPGLSEILLVGLSLLIIGVLGASATLARSAISEASAAVEDRRFVQARLAAIVESSDDAIISKDLHGIVSSWNLGAERLFGYTASEMIGTSIMRLVPPERQAEETEILRRIAAGERVEHIDTFRIHRDGRRLEVALSVSPIQDGAGRIVGASKIARDITERAKEARYKAFLLAELDHRVKNNLSVVLALAEETTRGSTSIAQFNESFIGRLHALARTHGALAASRWKGVPLQDLFFATLESFMVGAGTPDGGQRVRLEGENVHLSPRAAAVLCMTVNELATNATKYGALSKKEGWVQVRCRRGTDAAGLPVANVTWKELGGPAVTAPSRRGFGTELIENGVSYELGGVVRTEYCSDGLCCEIEFPLNERNTSQSGYESQGKGGSEGGRSA